MISRFRAARSQWLSAGRYALGGLAIIAIVHYGLMQPMLAVLTNKTGTDFYGAYCNAKSALELHNSMYDRPAMEAVCRQAIGNGSMPNYVYPPFSVLLFAPFLAYPPLAACAVWGILCLGVYLAALFSIERLLAAAQARRTSVLIPLVFAAVTCALYEPLRAHFWYGQTNLLVVAAAVGMAFGLRRDDRTGDMAAGFCFAAALLIKVFPVVWAPLLVLQRRWRLLGFTAVAMVILAAASLTLTTRADWLYYPTQLSATHYVRFGSPLLQNMSIKHGLMRQLAATTLEGGTQWALAFLPFCMLYGVFAWGTLQDARREPKSRVNLILLMRLSAVMPLLSLGMGSYWEHHGALALPAFYIAFNLLRPHGAHPKLLTLGVLAMVCLGAPPRAAAWLSAASGLTLVDSFFALNCFGTLLACLFFEACDLANAYHLTGLVVAPDQGVKRLVDKVCKT